MKLPTLTGILAFLCLVMETVGSAHFIYMTSYCSRTLQVNTSLSLALTSESFLNSDRESMDFLHCALDLTSPPGWKLFAHFLQMSIAPETHHVDRVELYDMEPKKVRITPPQGLYGKLERSLFMFDDSGTFVEDYKSGNRKMRIDYLGKPTIQNPGFRLLITAVQEPNSEGDCSPRLFHCARESLCVPVVTTCDGFHNCGMGDTSDESSCDSDNKITNLLENYSLTRDILVAICLPVFVFVLIVVTMLLCAKRHVRKHYPESELPAVHFSPRKGGQVKINIQSTQTNSRLYAPPSYEDIVYPQLVEPPPAYSSLANLAMEGAIVVSSKEDLRKASLRNHWGKIGQDPYSVSSVDLEDNGGESSSRKITQYEMYRKYKSCPSDSDNDDEEAKQRRRKKGIGVKGKGKRQVDGLSPKHRNTPYYVSNNHSASVEERLQKPSSLGTSSSVSSCQVPFDSSSIAQSSPKPSLPENVLSDRNSASTPCFTEREGILDQQKFGEFIPIHVKVKSDEQPLLRETPTLESPQTEEDRKSETESTSPWKRNSFTESQTSSIENVKQEDLTQKEYDTDPIKRKALENVKSPGPDSNVRTTIVK